MLNCQRVDIKMVAEWPRINRRPSVPSARTRKRCSTSLRQLGMGVIHIQRNPAILLGDHPGTVGF